MARRSAPASPSSGQPTHLEVEVRERAAKVQSLYSLDAVVVQVQHPHGRTLFEVADSCVPLLIERQVRQFRERLLQRHLGAMRL